jgi:lysophospholipase L1-like esterase
MSLNYRKKRKKIVFFGDSITEQGARPGGYITRILRHLKEYAIDDDYELVGAGVFGDKVYDLYLRMDEDILSKGADIVVIYIGVNDVWDKVAKLTGTEVEKFEKFYDAIINKILSAGIKVVLCTPSLIGENLDGNQYEDELEMYSHVIKSLAVKHDLEVIDLRNAFVSYNLTNNPDNAEQGILTVDMVHLNDKGNQLVADEMWKVLQNIK